MAGRPCPMFYYSLPIAAYAVVIPMTRTILIILTPGTLLLRRCRNPPLIRLHTSWSLHRIPPLDSQMRTLEYLRDSQSLSKDSKERMSNSVTQQVHFMQGRKFDALSTSSDYQSLALCNFRKSFFKDCFYYKSL